MLNQPPLKLPKDYPVLRISARPNHANKRGDVFGGWLMAQIDIAGSIPAHQRARGPVATIAVQHIQFIKPLFVHDLVSFYANITRVGHTSITVDIEVYAQRWCQDNELVIKISTATLVYVAVLEPGKARPLPQE